MRQVALITGGTRGIGLGISRELALKGFDLALNGMRPDEQVQEVLDELRESGGEVIYCRGNVSEAADREQMLKRILENYGRLNLPVNNAARVGAQKGFT